MIWKICKYLFLGLAIILAQSCGIYSFTGSNISPDIKTIAIKNFINVSGNGPAQLSQNFSERMRDFFQKNTNLQVVKNNGDIEFEGTISEYRLVPVSAQNSSNPNVAPVAPLMRLRIVVKAKFTNRINEKENFEQEIAGPANLDFPSNRTLSQYESSSQSDIDENLDAIILDIFNKSLANW